MQCLPEVAVQTKIVTFFPVATSWMPVSLVAVHVAKVSVSVAAHVAKVSVSVAVHVAKVAVHVAKVAAIATAAVATVAVATVEIDKIRQ
uniref:Uncharacterized protein n=1 Tax=Globodera pallida TaxID=36090 RepID=A0A183BZ64_GLOPA